MSPLSLGKKTESAGMVASDGGMVRTKGVQVSCPCGAVNAFDSPVTIKISAEDPSKYYGLIFQKGLQNDVIFGAPIINLQPNGQQFQKPVTVTANLYLGKKNCTDKFIILHGTKAANEELFWRDISHNSTINLNKGVVKVEVNHFSLIAVLRLLKTTWILSKDILSRLNLSSFNYTLTVLFKENHPHSRDGELALVFMSQDTYHEDYYREHEDSALMQVKLNGFEELCSKDGRKGRNIYNKENLDVLVSLGKDTDYQLASARQKELLVTVDSPVWWSTGHVVKLPLRSEKEVRILCGKISVHGQYGHASEYHFCQQGELNVSLRGKRYFVTEEVTNNGQSYNVYLMSICLFGR